MSGEDDVAFRLLHTADWHLGKRFPAFDEPARTTLQRARLQVLDDVFAAATRNAVDAVLCAGDLFDEPEPGADWWRGLLDVLGRLPRDFPKVFLLPGNHDPLLPASVWAPAHPFRKGLPPFVRVVDRADFREEIAPGLVLHAVPCTSKAGAGDPVEQIPPRAAGDESVRVGLVHGTTFDLPGCQMNFPIGKDGARAKGLDYLAIGDTHGYRVVVNEPPVVYPGAPEPTAFDEVEPGHVVLVCFTRNRRALLRKEPVARWRWRDERIRDVAALRALAAEDLGSTVLRLSFDVDVDLRECDEMERILADLQGNEARSGRAGVLDVDRNGIRMRVGGGGGGSAGSDGAFPRDLPPVLQATVAKLTALAGSDDATTARRAKRALFELSRLCRQEVER